MPLPAPRHDLRPGARSASVFRLSVIALLCALQYWLLTSAMEGLQAGDRSSALPAFIASLLCFALAAGLLLDGERGARKTERFLASAGDHDAHPRR
jgi:hypothetical protein